MSEFLLEETQGLLAAKEKTVQGCSKQIHLFLLASVGCNSYMDAFSSLLS